MSDINELKEKFDRHELDVSSLTEIERGTMYLFFWTFFKKCENFVLVVIF